MIGIDDVRAAAKRLAGVARVTALERSDSLAERIGADVWLKIESRQRTGSFKLRGAYNKIAQLSETERAAGVVAASAGNHAQGVAFAAAEAQIPARIVMPDATPVVKVSQTQSLGATVILHGSDFDEAYAHAVELSHDGSTFVHPFNDPDVIAGQGTVGLEILERNPDVDTLIVPVGGGGLIAGIATAARALRPECRIIGVEAEHAAAMAASLDAGRVVSLPTAQTLADGIAVRVPGDYTFGIIRELVDEIVTVTDAQIARAMLAMLERHKLVVEGAGAAPLAALDVLACDDLGDCVALVISGGNVDVNILARIIDRGLVEAGRSIRVTVSLIDKPGALAELATVLGDARANIMEITHDRMRSDIDIGDAQVELVLATRGTDHARQILGALAARGYDPRAVG